jgi:PPOX class probable F420-dependent enzyme
LARGDSVEFVDIETCRRLFASSPVARLATVGATGPHLVPVTFAVAADHVYTAVDHKPKVSRRLRRLTNIAHSPLVSLLVDHYDDNWESLWWVRADGVARVIEEPLAMANGLDLLVSRYSQYRNRRPEGPLIEVAVAAWRGWSAAGGDLKA